MMTPEEELQEAIEIMGIHIDSMIDGIADEEAEAEAEGVEEDESVAQEKEVIKACKLVLQTLRDWRTERDRV